MTIWISNLIFLGHTYVTKQAVLWSSLHQILNPEIQRIAGDVHPKYTLMACGNRRAFRPFSMDVDKNLPSFLQVFITL